MGATKEVAKGVIDALPITISDQPVTLQVHILESDSYNLLLGGDFIKRLNAYPVPDERVVHFSINGKSYTTPLFLTRAEEAVFEAESNTPLIRNPSDRTNTTSTNEIMTTNQVDICYNVTITEPLIIPADQYCQWTPPRPDNAQVRQAHIFEAHHAALLPHHVYAAHSYGPLSHLHVQLQNLTSHEVVLPPGLTIGHLEPSSEAQVTPVRRWTDVRKGLTSKGPQYTVFTSESLQTKTSSIISDDDLRATCDNQLTNTQVVSLLQLLRDNEDLFAKDAADLGRTHLLAHHIHLDDDTPIYMRPYRYSPREQDFIAKEIQRMLTHGIISPSNGPWAFPVVLIRKKDGSIRFCVDYRRLNKATKKDRYPLPRIDEIFDSLAGVSWFSALDLVSGYWQVPMSENDKAKTAFITKYGTYQFEVMPFGLSNAPATFQRLMDQVYTGLLWVSVFVYLDDTQVFSKTFEQHLVNLQVAFDRLRTAGLKIKLSKCEFGKRELTFLGFRTGKDGLRVDPDKIDKIVTCPPPQNVGEIRCFLGLASYYRRFVPNFAAISEPIRRLLKKNEPFQWTDQQQQAFDTLKRALISPPTLAYPNFDAPFILATDASYDGFGAILSQKDNEGLEHPIHYASRATTAQERQFATVTELEAAALVWALDKFRHYLLQSHVHIYTDHQALQYIIDNKELNRKFARWALRVAEFPHLIEYRKGARNANADALSRPPFIHVANVTLNDGEEPLLVQRLTHTARLPTRATSGAAGLDLYANRQVTIKAHSQAAVHTGIAIQTPSDTYARIAPRSGLARSHSIHVQAGVIDSDYRGEVIALLYNMGDKDLIIRPGDRFAQLILERIRQPEVEESQQLSPTTRAAAGFGSTGYQTK
jgi:deoxyuridine 5'-triphosphate nucleotidohydrolase